MTLWLAISLLTGIAIMAVLWPLRTRTSAVAAEGQADLAVYRDQLAEIERDRAGGLIGAAEGEAARAEVARRILRVADAGGTAPLPSRDGRRRIAAVLALIGIPLFAGGLYFALGSPQFAGQPLAARLDAGPDKADVAILVRRVEDHLKANPDDGRGYEIIAPVYFRLGRYDDAARAWANAIRLNGSSAGRQNGLGETLTSAAGGVVTAEAKAAFEATLKDNPKDPMARYFLGLAAEQDGRPQEAASIWSALAADTPPGAPWSALLQGALARVGAPVANQPGPSAADVAAAQEMSAEDRNAMVRGMVDRLSQRLSENGDDLEGWLRLMRAWNVLGEAGKAREATAKARTQFAGNLQALGRIDALAQELGLGS